jgi:hypothetical protein
MAETKDPLEEPKAALRKSAKELARTARSNFAFALVELSEEDETAEVRQMLIDTMDACEQSALGNRISAALTAFDGKVGA